MFRFRLQQVLNLREQQERELASQLVRAMTIQQHAQTQRDILQAARNASAAHGVAVGQVRSVGELANLAFVLQQLDNQIASADDAVDAAGQQVTQMQEAVTAAVQDRRVLDRLRDRDAETHRSTEEQLDRRTMDDIALTRYTQQGTP